LASEAAGDENGRTTGAGGLQKCGERLDIFIGIEGLGGAFGFAEADQVGRDDLAGHREVRINLRPLVGGGAEEKTVEKNERRAGAADMVDDFAVGGVCHAGGEDRGGNLVGNPVGLAAAMPKGQGDGPE